MDAKERIEIARTLLQAAEALEAGVPVAAGSIDTLIGRLKNLHSEAAEALHAAELLKKNPAKYAPQADNLRSSLKTVMQTAKVLLREADKVSGSAVVASADKIRRLIDQNHHGQALQMAAAMAKADPKLFKAIKGMNEIHDYFKSLPPGLDHVRAALTKRLKAHLTHKANHLDEEEKAELLGLL